MKLSILLISIMLLLAVLIAPEPHRPLPRAEAATFTVTNLADSGPGTLRQAILDANATTGIPDVINFSVAGMITLSTQLDVTDDLTINGSGITLDGNNTTRIMQISSVAIVTLNDLIFQNGGGDFGGAIYNDGGTLTTNTSTFNNNSATSGVFNDGGAIYSDSGTLEITNSTFNGNTAYDGGVIYNVFGTATITNSTFSNTTNGHSGAIYNFAGTLYITTSTFTANTAGDFGGAISSGGQLTITNSTFSGNSADFTDGGAIANLGSSSATITGSTFSGNMAERWGGAIYSSSNTLTITNSAFSDNTAFEGGVIYNQGSTLDITNSTFSNNQADFAGGVIDNEGPLTITNSTFSGNAATGFGGGAIYNLDTLATTSSTFSGNSAPDGGTFYRDGSGAINMTSSLIVDGDCDGAITDGGNNLSFNASGCPGTIADPQLGPLQDNGGPTHTMLPALSSSAVNAYSAPCATATDQRGIARPLGAGCDIGSTEQVGPVMLVASAACVNENLDVTITDGDSPFDITASAGINTPVNGVGIGTTIINGPEKWDDVTVTETTGDLQAINLGQFKCRTDERPVPISPSHRSRTTDPFPTFAWTPVSFANNYRVFVFDDRVAANRTVDIRQNSGGPTTMQLSTPLPDGRLFWRVRGRTNRVWGLWSIRFTLFKDPVAPITISENTLVPTIDLNPPSGKNPDPTQVPTVGPASTLPSPPNSR